MKKLYILFSLFLLSNINAQLTYQWSGSAGSATNPEYGQSIAADPSGNVYVSGIFTGVVDFDPSAGTTTLSSMSGSQDIFLAKYSASGAFIWVKQIAGTNTERPFDLTCDASGVYLAGIFMGTMDFDPSAATNTLTSLGGGPDGDAFFAKYDVNGALVWRDRIGSTGNDRCVGIVVDNLQNVYVSGFIGANADMDPSAATLTFSVAGTYNAYFGKYSSTGALVFAKQIVGGYSEGDDINIDGSGNIYLTGSYATLNDFDPNAGTQNLSTSSLTQLDIFLAKYTSTGVYTYAKQIGGIGVDIGWSVVPDATGNVYLCGVFSSVCDFDPTAATFTLSSAGQGDLFVSKYNNVGSLTWVNGTGGANNDYAEDMAIDASNNIYITGKFQGTNIDFDPSASTAALTGASNSMYIAGYTSAGAYLFANTTGVTSEGRGMRISGSSVFVSGSFQSSADFDFSASTATLTSLGGDDAFWAKYNACTGAPPLQPSAISGSITACANSNLIYSVTNDPSATSYTWLFPSGTTGSSSTNTISVNTGSTSGIVSVTANNGCGPSPSQTLNVTYNALPNVTASTGTSACAGGMGCLTSSGANTYTWVGPCAFSSTIQNPCFPFSLACSCIFSVTGTDVNGCNKTAATCITILPNPTVTAVSSNSLLCTGQTATLTANGATSYSWIPGGAGVSIAVSPSVTTTYTVVGTNSVGCSSSTVITQNVSGCTGVARTFEQVLDLKVFPNPTNGIVTITYKMNWLAYEIFDSMGQKVNAPRRYLKEGVEVDLTALPSGIYFVRVGDSKFGYKTKKIVKE